jgi:hypothetical protein
MVKDLTVVDLVCLLTTGRGYIAIGICCLYSSIQNLSEAIGSS